MWHGGRYYVLGSWLLELPDDVLKLIMYQLPLAHHIARAAPTCHVVSVAARNAIKVRQFSSEVVT